MRQKTENTTFNQTPITVKDIAEREGVSTKTVYRYLKNLDGLLFDKYSARRLSENGMWRFELATNNA